MTTNKSNSWKQLNQQEHVTVPEYLNDDHGVCSKTQAEFCTTVCGSRFPKCDYYLNCPGLHSLMQSRINQLPPDIPE